MEKRQELYKGKAKTVYATDDPHYLVKSVMSGGVAVQKPGAINKKK